MKSILHEKVDLYVICGVNRSCNKCDYLSRFENAQIRNYEDFHWYIKVVYCNYYIQVYYKKRIQLSIKLIALKQVYTAECL